MKNCYYWCKCRLMQREEIIEDQRCDGRCTGIVNVCVCAIFCLKGNGE